MRIRIENEKKLGRIKPLILLGGYAVEEKNGAEKTFGRPLRQHNSFIVKRYQSNDGRRTGDGKQWKTPILLLRFKSLADLDGIIKKTIIVTIKYNSNYYYRCVLE